MNSGDLIMLKRNSKAISLMLAAAAIISTVPAMADEIRKVDAQEGTIQSAKAYGNGVFLVDGYKTEDDNTDVYYVTEDGNFHKIDGLDSDNDTFGDGLQNNQYAEIIGSKWNEYIDLKNGYKVVGEDIRETMVDNAARKVKYKIKNDNNGRFEKDYYENTTPSASVKRTGETSTFLEGFSGTWSHYNYKLKDVLIGDEIKGNTESYSTIYSDLEGNYIDGDYSLGSLTVSTTSASVTIKNTHDTYEIKDDGVTYELKAEINEKSFLSESYSDMYRSANLTVFRKVKGANDSTYKPATGDLSFGGSSNNHKITPNSDGSVTVIQKFSKAQASDSVDGIKYPQSSEIYFITDEDGKREGLLGLSDKSKISGAGYGYGGILSGMKGITSFYIDLQNKKVYAESLNLKQKKGYKYVDVSDYDRLDLTNSNAKSLTGGNLWVVNDGYIETYDVSKEAFVKQYKVDSSMDEISMSGSNNIIVWNEDNGIYSIIYNKSVATGASGSTAGSNGNVAGNTAVTGNVAGAAGTTTQNSTATGAVVTDGNTAQSAVMAGAATAGSTAKTGWLKNADSTWSYIKADGTKTIGWVKDNEKWYYLKANGIMATGWVNDNGTWYYLNSNGSMATGWIKDGQKWYYLDSSGAMLLDTTINGYVLGNDGAWIQ
jgi:hypothetical protein